MPSPFLIAGVGALGVALGPLLDRAVDRFPRHQPEPRAELVGVGAATAPTGATSPDRSGRAGCTSECRPPLPHRRVVITALTAGLFGAVGARFGWSWDLLPALAVTGAVLPLAFCDAEHLLLPRRLAWLGTSIVGASVLVAAAGTGSWHRLEVAGITGLAAGGAMATISLINPRWLGFGDSRLAALIGLGVGWLGAGPALGALLLANVGAGLGGLAVIAGGRRGQTPALPFGVFLAGGAVAALLLAG